LDGMMAKDRLLDLVENFILYDDSKPGGTRKVVARNHQVLGVNNSVQSVQRQQALRQEFPPQVRLRHRLVEVTPKEPECAEVDERLAPRASVVLPLIER